ncbi:DUF551 domain-containing protein [Klebsiella pasteurii]|uniref:DUF551 domain-containing protein n=1 Tax=Klebsiella pasteurii TaxID=2587529 RepID=UPI001C7E092A|nr:DUF551 domain-containing protein [Klebsiella pasteurii]
MTKSTITRERLEEIVSDPMINHGSEFAMMARMALAAMDSEPVAEVCEDYAIRYISSGPAPKEGLHPGDKLYRHAQQPVVNYVPLGDSPYDVPYSMPSNLRELIAEEIGILFSDDDAQSVWNVCRSAAMLQAGNSPAIPGAEQRIADAVELLKKAAPAMLADNGGPDGPLAGRLKSPVIPGWVPVSERMPEVGVKVLCYPVGDEPIHATFNGQLWLQDVSWSGSDEPIDNVIPVSVTHWMPLPADPQEVK